MSVNTTNEISEQILFMRHFFYKIMREKRVQISYKGLYEGAETYRKGLCVCVSASLCQYEGGGEQCLETSVNNVK